MTALEPACPIGGERCLTPGEVEIARSIYGNAINLDSVRIRRRKWWPLQPRNITMAPRGHLHFHPRGRGYSDDFSKESVIRQGLLVHELAHVWQTQTKGDWYLVLHRHPFCRYDYSLKPGQPLTAYGIEQQAEIIKHAFLLRRGVRIAGAPDKSAYDLLVNFDGATL